MESEARTIRELVPAAPSRQRYMLAPASECESHKEATSRSTHGAISHFDEDLDRGSLPRSCGCAPGSAGGRKVEDASGDLEEWC